MLRLIIILLFCSLSFNSFSQKTLKNLLPKTGNRVESFIPKGWLKLYSTTGDFNKDGLKDVALIVIDSVTEKVAMEYSRSLVILKGQDDGFILSGYCDSAILCYSCGGVHGDPFESLRFDGDKIILQHIVGSAYRSELKSIFRYQQGDWLLIGESIKGAYLNARCENQQRFGGLFKYDKNYLTRQYLIKEFDESNCKI